MKLGNVSSFTARFERLSIASNPLRPCSTLLTSPLTKKLPSGNATRTFTSTAARAGNWLLPTAGEKKRSRKGRPRVPTGGSARGTTVVWGDFGLRMCDHHRRVPASALKIGEDAIKVRLKGMRYRLYKRVAAQIGVYSSGNEVRMGKGKGSFDHWAARVAVNKVLFEVRGDVHEQIVRDAFRIAGNKMPGMYEFVKRGDPPVVGITKLDPANGITLETLKRPRRAIPLGTTPPPAIGKAAGAIPTVSTSLSPSAEA